MSDEQLYWHCASCGAHEQAHPEHGDEHGDTEKCITCGDDFARVMTLKEGAAIEQAVALGKLPDRRKRGDQ